MTHQAHARGAAGSQLRFVPRKQLLASACALALVSTFAVHAQDAQQGQVSEQQNQDVSTLGTVQVTGIRAAVAKAVEVKNESTSIVEAISAEDIGKLPDISIADSISRLPGLAAQRVDGRSQVINIRGMSEQFSSTLLNGREQVSTGDSRGVEFDQYPAELINAVTVYKTPDAALIGQGIAGTVDLQAIRPLSYGQRRIVLNANGEYNTLGKLTAGADDKGYRASASYVDQFANDTVGIAIGVARLDSPFQEKHYKAWWWSADAQAGRPAGAIGLNGAENWIKSRNLTRDGVMGVFEFKPNDTYHSVLDVYYSKFDQDETMRGVMWDNSPWANNGTVNYTGVGTSQVGGDTLVTSGTMNNVRPVVRNDSNLRDDKIVAAGWNNAFNIGGWVLSADLNYSRAEREQSNLETYAGPLGNQSIEFSLPTTPDFAWFSAPNFADPNTVYLSDPAGWNHDGRMENSKQVDRIRAARFDLSRDLDSDFFSKFQVGANFNRREKEKTAEVFFADLKNGRAPVLVDPGLLRSPTSLGFSGVGGVLSYDPRALLGRYYDVTRQMSDDDVRKDFVVEEDVDTFYMKMDIDTDLTDRIRLRGNFGMQWIESKQSSTAFNVQNGNADRFTRGTEYDDLLPSMNLVADFGGGWMVRLGGAKTLMRAPINWLNAASGAGVDPTTREWSGGGGNPLLEPYRARAGDLSVEKYFGTASYVGLAVFYKHLESYVYQQAIQGWDFSDYPNDSGVTPISNVGVFTTWGNGKGGYMRGAELSTALEGELFHSALDGFGAQLNVSYTETSIKPNGPGTSETTTLPGLSKIVANATVYYEKNGFGARISQRYRDSYRGEYAYIHGNRAIMRSMSERQLDLQLSYEFGESSALNGLSLLFQVNNLNNSPYRTVQDSNFPGGAMAPQEYNEYGRQYLMGVSYKFN
ncbi:MULTISPECIES: TonB-dependent receptor [unclassified Pseudoxanthomonas]|uniref:TonB-dependent receptor n=1 Tax=unclassified Pseudoxanthomonas TaxID=2645906 RepID=UPI00160F6FDC|nr:MULTISPECIES: TonB-dependent receptor [unclassified Pseudoxanthomonas]MBB3276373.1 iron complex outermembrane receptor protein [Pseudoxanthomonas sp. OG2]MBV7472551.1 TonB-dependent receptor [Pseudoxanthomonas sp. PXM05]